MRCCTVRGVVSKRASCFLISVTKPNSVRSDKRTDCTDLLIKMVNCIREKLKSISHFHSLLFFLCGCFAFYSSSCEVTVIINIRSLREVFNNELWEVCYFPFWTDIIYGLVIVGSKK